MSTGDNGGISCEIYRLYDTDMGHISGTVELSGSSCMGRDHIEKLVPLQEISATGPTLTHINPNARPGWPAVGHFFFKAFLKLC